MKPFASQSLRLSPPPLCSRVDTSIFCQSHREFSPSPPGVRPVATPPNFFFQVPKFFPSPPGVRPVASSKMSQEYVQLPAPKCRRSTSSCQRPFRRATWARSPSSCQKIWAKKKGEEETESPSVGDLPIPSRESVGPRSGHSGLLLPPCGAPP